MTKTSQKSFCKNFSGFNLSGRRYTVGAENLAPLVPPHVIQQPKGEPKVKSFGICLMIAGVIWGAYAFNMKTSIETEGRSLGAGLYSVYVPSQTVHNLDLADRRRNHLIVSGFTFLSGIMLFGFGSLQPQTQKSTAQNTNITSEIHEIVWMNCPKCGAKTLNYLSKCSNCRHELH